MKKKILITLLILLSFTACKSNLCNPNSTFIPSQAMDRRCMKIEKEEDAKDPDACKESPEYINAQKKRSEISAKGKVHTPEYREAQNKILNFTFETSHVSPAKCQALIDRSRKRCDALPPAKDEDWIPLSGNIFVSNGKPVAQDGKPLPKCSECKSCTPAEPTTPPTPVQPQPQQAPVTPPQTTQPSTTTKSAHKTLPPLPIPPPEPPPQPTL